MLMYTRRVARRLLDTPAAAADKDEVLAFAAD
jgi:hypothetical protein